MDEVRTIVAAGDPQHPDHKAWLLTLGEATYAASRVTGITFDILRVFGDVDSGDMYSDPLGRLLSRLQKLRKSQPGLPGINEFIETLDSARQTRNDLLHALPVRDGLHRRSTHGPGLIRNFFTVADLEKARDELNETWVMGSTLLYHDGGIAVKAWYTKSQEVSVQQS